MSEHSQNIWQCHRYRENLPVTCTGHQISQIKPTFDLFSTKDKDFNPNFSQIHKLLVFNFLHPFSSIFCPICSREMGTNGNGNIFFKGGDGLIWAIWDGGQEWTGAKEKSPGFRSTPNEFISDFLQHKKQKHRKYCSNCFYLNGHTLGGSIHRLKN